MNPLAQLLQKALADTFSFYFKTHNYHWNVEGNDFPQYHEFLNELYEEVYSSVDLIAELIRTLDVKVIASYTSFKNTTSIQEVDMIPADARNMFMDLSRDNDTVILALLQAYRTAETMGEIGISNVLQDRITAHQKHGWMIKSILK